MDHPKVIASFIALSAALTACTITGETTSVAPGGQSTTQEHAPGRGMKDTLATTSVADIPHYGTEESTLEITVAGKLNPASELMISTPCTPKDATATAAASFGKSTTLTRVDDVDRLIGTITTPERITAGPDNGKHIITVECASGLHGNVTIPDADDSSSSSTP